MGSTSRGLVASVRATHKWLLVDFVWAIVKIELAANWALEALAALPEVPEEETWQTWAGQGKKVTDHSAGGESKEECCIPSSDSADDGNDNMVKFTILLLRGIVAVKSNDNPQERTMYASANRVSCSDTVVAPTIPFYQSLLSLLERLIPQSRQRSHRSRLRDSVYNEINSKAAAFRATLLESENYEDIAAAVAIIEKQRHVFTAWQRDFVAVTLGYADRELGHSAEELEVLALLALTLPGLSAKEGDVCRWVLLKDDLRTHLHGPSKFLRATRGILLLVGTRSVLDLEILDMVLKGLPDSDLDCAGTATVTAGADQYDEEKGGGSCVHNSAEIGELRDDNTLILPRLKHHCVQQLWWMMLDREDSTEDLNQFGVTDFTTSEDHSVSGI